MPVTRTPSKLQKKAALRVDALAPDSLQLQVGNAKTTPGFATFVGDATTGLSATPSAKIAQARRLARETREETQQKARNELRKRFGYY